VRKATDELHENDLLINKNGRRIIELNECLVSNTNMVNKIETFNKIKMNRMKKEKI
jgi:hypothetical protein